MTRAQADEVERWALAYGLEVSRFESGNGRSHTVQMQSSDGRVWEEFRSHKEFWRWVDAVLRT